MSDREVPPIKREALAWIEQLREDIAHDDWSTALEESLPEVISHIEEQTERPLDTEDA